MEDKKKLLKALPKVDECIGLLKDTPESAAPLRIIKSVVQDAIEEERGRILKGTSSVGRTEAEWLEIFRGNIARKLSPHFKRVINGTGVVIHTNLGRSVLSRSTTDRLVQAGAYYSNLEFDLATGKRGSRYSLVEDLLCELTGAEAALVVNNNAAAVLLALDTLAKDREVIVSRGQLVEIGGSFRIPEVMAKSGAKLVEVGATNRTHLFDYQRAITPETAMLLRVHTSNFRIIGFTSEVSPEEMVALAREHELITMEDLGSGSLIDFSRFGFPKEPTVYEIVQAGVDVVTFSGDKLLGGPQAGIIIDFSRFGFPKEPTVYEIVQAGVDVVTFSGDKLLGGPQAGIIIGKKDVIARIKKNPLNRALRIDKFTLAALESVLREYFDTEAALKNIPTLAMLTIAGDELKKRAQRIARLLKKKIAEHCRVQLVPTISRVGGGALPEFNIDSWAIDLQPLTMKLSTFEQGLRKLAIPIIGRIESERFLLDVRTIQDVEVGELVTLLGDFFNRGGGVD